MAPENPHGQLSLDSLLSLVGNSPSLYSSTDEQALAQTCMQKKLELCAAETRLRYYSDDPRFRGKVDKGGYLIPAIDLFPQSFSMESQEFVHVARSMGYPIDLWIHSASDSKADIGYHPEEIAITLVYAADEFSTKYFVFTRNTPEKIIGKIPRSTIRKLVGVRDVKAAADQAEQNLRESMRRGSIGPFGLRANDQVFVDQSSYEQSKMHLYLKVNFSAGSPHSSFNMRLVDATEVMFRGLYPGRVKVVDLWGQQDNNDQ